MTGRPRRPWLAALMAAFCSGFGHLYVGRWRPALAIPVVVFGGLALTLTAVLLAGGSSLTALAAGGSVGLALWLLQILAAARIASNTPTDYQLARSNRWWIYLLYVLAIQVASAAPAMALRANVLELFKIPSDSMQPTLLPGDFVAVPKIGPASAGPPAVGQLAVFAYPRDPEVSYIKRIVALEGETARVQRHRLDVEGGIQSTPCNQPTVEVTDVHGRGREAHCWQESSPSGLTWPVLVSRAHARGPTANWGPEIVPPGELLMFGDFRTSSSDSRVWGTVPAANLIGRPDQIVFSWDRARGPRWDRVGQELQPR